MSGGSPPHNDSARLRRDRRGRLRRLREAAPTAAGSGLGAASQALILRWAVQQIEATMATRHRRKPRGGSDEVFEQGMARVVDQLLGWSRLIHKIPRLREPTDP